MIIPPVPFSSLVRISLVIGVLHKAMNRVPLVNVNGEISNGPVFYRALQQTRYHSLSASEPLTCRETSQRQSLISMAYDG